MLLKSIEMSEINFQKKKKGIVLLWLRRVRDFDGYPVEVDVIIAPNRLGRPSL